MNPSLEEQSVIHSTFVIERRYPKLPQEVFSAFADTAKKRRWFAEGENQEVEEFAMDFRVGGTERSRYRFKPGTPFQGVALINEVSYLDIVPNRRIVTASTMTVGDACPTKPKLCIVDRSSRPRQRGALHNQDVGEVGRTSTKRLVTLTNSSSNGHV